jgi:hypothetical protein
MISLLSLEKVQQGLGLYLLIPRGLLAQMFYQVLLLKLKKELLWIKVSIPKSMIPRY